MFFITKIRKIAIVGGPGTGKTTLSNFLVKQHFLPVYHIDEIKYSQGWQERSKKEIQKELLAITKKQEWIIEGNSKIALSTIIEKADLVIFLDFSTLEQLKGILKRFFLSFCKEKLTFYKSKEKLRFSFLLKTLFFNRVKRPLLMRFLKRKPCSQVIILKNVEELRQWLKNN